jgi:uncharacterized OB-fold protein
MNETAPVRIAPQTDRDSSQWWAYVRAHRLHWQRCAACGSCRWPARDICATCRAFDWDWVPASELATVASWITTHHSVVPGLAAPYRTVIVRPIVGHEGDQPDFFLPGLWDGDEQPMIGMVVRVHYDDFESSEGTAFTLLGWQPESSSAHQKLADRQRRKSG